ncbi:MAG TPA: pyrroloquinoline quinone biosynthesis peptide chaperone PqqD [Steroidobacteraceae bacterium]|nr:pyrroloquinoline quinone biosynthesis peptide chaperone PqqD [Steroidobacteraceae bacterium]
MTSSAGSRPRLAAGYRLQWEAAQNANVLLYPEGMVKLNQSAGEILKRCDGAKSLDTIVADLESAFDRKDLGPSIFEFVSIATANGWLQDAP